MQFTSLLRRNEIGANSYLIEMDGQRIVLDSGMHPKEEGLDSLPAHHELPADSIDSIFVSHSHLDHSGSLPVLMRDQPGADVFMTPATAKLIDALLHNSVNVMESKRTELGITDYPFYTHRELDDHEKRWRTFNYERPFQIGDNVRASFHDAGHILGSSGIMLETPEKRVFYTGDVQFEDQTLIPGADLPEEDIDTLIIETTRGASPRCESYSREVEEQKFAESINDCLKRGGSVLVPVFAMGKTQEVLTMINRFKQEGLIPDAPVYIGGLSTKMTIIFDEFADSTPRNQPGFRILKDMEVKTGGRRRKRAPIVYQPGGIYALSSGMMTEKTVSNNFARGFISNPKNSLLFVGYADPDSPAGHIRAGKQGDLIDLDPAQDPIQFNCPMEVFDFSGHATRDDLLSYILRVKPKKTILVHGDLPATEWFAQQLKEKLPECETIIPLPGKPYQL
ncbi:MBL fold metallo-hydrolase [Verrucomicrobiaceae bacterium R5-34]|uniref:MBL fold metallo-hydrolase n=1 Tax=Oceaniferula flava TaxID=2800421 RepID=A0AAE2SBU7_9BACT|nr:MBL fold metallo-hydrolase [Oceaniferula flavus]MBK1829387.1 MBL fold metallo-hydrolase [Verrucomicrobiaceae bacterium R5-34]MBK1853615.1 MBL fold metallo-hydrolase [Oceaniferula flavus]MBM1134920.1 MBL fold metallo-hydrolase [Oceaniferula flavus]